MERLTERLPNGVVRSDLHGDTVMLRLAAYEDTGLEPSEVAALRARCEAAVRDLDRMAEQGNPCLYCAKRMPCEWDDPDGCFVWRGPQE